MRSKFKRWHPKIPCEPPTTYCSGPVATVFKFSFHWFLWCQLIRLISAIVNTLLSSFMAMIASVTMNFPHISTHNISSNQTFSPICTNNPSNFSSSSSSSIPISSNSIRLSSSIAYSEQLIASHNVNRRTKNRKIKVSMYD